MRKLIETVELTGRRYKFWGRLELTRDADGDPVYVETHRCSRLGVPGSMFTYEYEHYTRRQADVSWNEYKAQLERARLMNEGITVTSTNQTRWC